MIQTAVAAFVGCFTAIVVLAEIALPNKIVRYLAAFLVGVIVTVLLALFLQWVADMFARAA